MGNYFSINYMIFLALKINFVLTDNADSNVKYRILRHLFHLVFTVCKVHILGFSGLQSWHKEGVIGYEKYFISY